MRKRMRIGSATAIVAGVLALAGCASSSPQVSPGAGSSGGVVSSSGTIAGTGPGPSMGGTASAPPSASSLARAAAATCPNSTDVEGTQLPGAQSVAADVKVSFVLRCKILSPGGKPTTVVAERSTSSTAALVSALQAPSQPKAKVVCPMYVAQLPYFALVLDAGNIVAPKIPLDNCGKPQSAVLTALNTLQFTQISSRSLK